MALSTFPFDPKSIPIQSIGGEMAIPSERLIPEWLRARFVDPPKWIPEVSDEQPWMGKNLSPKIASVLLPIVFRDGGPTVMLTRRSPYLADHAGQISFPGGRSELIDTSGIETALRETEEEIGLHRRHIEVIGTLPEYLTRTGYLVTPVVSIVHPPFEIKADASEVEEVFEVPLAFLMDGSHHQLRVAEFPGGVGQRSFYTISYEDFFIWGATAAMLRNLFHFLRA